MGQGDYPLHEFALRLANVEEKYAREIQGLVECFTNSRLDLPAKKLEDLARARLKASRHLKKAGDPKKAETLALWKMCNIYSATAVDVDEAMREVRGNLRKRLNASGQTKDVSAFRRFVDEYRPANKRASEPPSEIYDTNKPTLKEKQRFLDMFKREKKDDKKVALHDAEQSYTQYLVDTAKASNRDDRKTIVIPPPPKIAPVQPVEKSESYAPKSNGTTTNRARSEEKKVLPPRPKTPAPAEPAPIPAPRNNRTQSVAPPKEARPTKALAPSPPMSKSTQEIHKINSNETPRIVYRVESQGAAPNPEGTKIAPTMIQIDDHGAAPTVSQSAHATSRGASPQQRRTGVLAQRHSIKISGSSSDEERPRVVVDRPQSMLNQGTAPMITNGKIQRFQTEAQPARPRLQAQMIMVSSSDEDEIIDRL